MDQEKTGAFISDIRRSKKMTQKQLADLMGVSDKLISKWECGRSLPDISYMDSLCASLDVSINELLSGERLSEEEYSRMAEDNMKNLIKDKEQIQHAGKIELAIGLFVVILLFCFILVNSSVKIMNVLPLLLDIQSLIAVAILCFAEILLSRKRIYGEVLSVLQKVSIPNGLLISLISLVLAMSEGEEIVIRNLVICILPLIYSILEYIVVIMLIENTRKKVDNNFPGDR